MGHNLLPSPWRWPGSKRGRGEEQGLDRGEKLGRHKSRCPRPISQAPTGPLDLPHGMKWTPLEKPLRQTRAYEGKGGHGGIQRGIWGHSASLLPATLGSNPARTAIPTTPKKSADLGPLCKEPRSQAAD